jgi:membrane fusion protein, multidrug efflux system
MRRSYLWAGLFTVAIVGWFASGELVPGDTGPGSTGPGSTGAQPVAEPRQDRAEAPFRVQVARFTAEPRHSQITVRGHTEASMRIEVRTRTQGIVEDSPFTQGDAVAQGDLLCRLDLAGRKAQLEQARAQLASAEQDHEAARTLRQSDFVSESKLAAERARLDLARAQLDQIELDIGWTEIRAPSEGVLARKPAEAGNYLEPGAVCASLSVLDPLLVVGQISERHVSAVQTGATANAHLATGETVEGTVRFIAPSAELATRTFRIELEVANHDHSLREGVTAELVIALPDQLAHKLPSSALTLSDQGQFGVRAVAEDNRARFHPVTLLAQEREGAWVQGLPDDVTIIVVGQEFVTDGQLVEPVYATAEAQ